MGRPSKAEIRARRKAGGESTSSAPVVRAKPGPPPGSRRVPALPGEVPEGHSFERLLTPDEVALWLGKPKATLYQWRTRGVGPRGIKIGGDLRYRRQDVEDFIEASADPVPAVQ